MPQKTLWVLKCTRKTQTFTRDFPLFQGFGKKVCPMLHFLQHERKISKLFCYIYMCQNHPYNWAMRVWIFLQWSESKNIKEMSNAILLTGLCESKSCTNVKNCSLILSKVLDSSTSNWTFKVSCLLCCFAKVNQNRDYVRWSWTLNGQDAGTKG